MFKRQVALPYKEFHNDAINKEVRLKDHITLWIKERMKCSDQHRPFDRHKIFTLCNYPWILDAEHKIELLAIEHEIKHHQEAQRIHAHIMNAGAFDLNPYLVLKVNRNNLIPDTLQKLVSGGLNLKKQLKVVFIGEPGIDEGGVRKEFFQLIIKELFDPNYGMFTQNNRRLFWFNGMSAECNVNFELIGIVTGLAISNNVILDMQFPMALYKML